MFFAQILFTPLSYHDFFSEKNLKKIVRVVEYNVRVKLAIRFNPDNKNALSASSRPLKHLQHLLSYLIINGFT